MHVRVDVYSGQEAEPSSCLEAGMLQGGLSSPPDENGLQPSHWAHIGRLQLPISLLLAGGPEEEHFYRLFGQTERGAAAPGAGMPGGHAAAHCVDQALLAGEMRALCPLGALALHRKVEWSDREDGEGFGEEEDEDSAAAGSLEVHVRRARKLKLKRSDSGYLLGC